MLGSFNLRRDTWISRASFDDWLRFFGIFESLFNTFDTDIAGVARVADSRSPMNGGELYRRFSLQAPSTARECECQTVLGALNFRTCCVYIGGGTVCASLVTTFPNTHLARDHLCGEIFRGARLREIFLTPRRCRGKSKVPSSPFFSRPSTCCCRDSYSLYWRCWD